LGNSLPGKENGRTLAACFLLSYLLGLAATTAQQLEILGADQPSAVFGGEMGVVQITFRNSGERSIEMPLKTRLFQLSSATRMPVGEVEPWKKLTVLAGQTVLETVRVKFPDVRGVTRFEVRWLDDADRAVGQVPVTVYPTNLLTQLTALAGEKSLGIFDPHEQLTPLLHKLGVEFDDLVRGERIKTWRGLLAILGPFDAKHTPASDVQKSAMALGAGGVNVLVLLPNDEHADSAVRAPHALRKAVIIRPVGAARIVTTSSDLVAGLATQPLAQEKLIELARLAIAPNLSLVENKHEN
jgi:hypothetical protein